MYQTFNIFNPGECVMKVKTGYLSVIFAGLCLAQTNDEKADDPDKVIIDVSKIGKKMGAPDFVL